jgi:3-oxoacyl-[acyl-carrier-protein] synthase-1
MRSPTGTTAPMSIANVLAGIYRKRRFKAIEDRNFVPVTLGMADYLNKKCSNNVRMHLLMERAFEETVQVLLKTNSKSIKLFMGVPAARPGLDQEFISQLNEKLHGLGIVTGLNLSIDYIRENHDSGMIALSKAADFLKAGLGDFVLIGGVDSYVSKETVAWLESQQLLKCSTNRNGFTPGEAASFCLLCTEQTAKQYQLPIKARILRVATAREPYLPGSEIPTAGKGITTAIATALQSLPENAQVAETFCTLKGLRHEVEEFSFSIVKTGQKIQQPGVFTTLVPNWGDIGAASAPALICYAAEKKELGFAEAGYQLIFTFSPGDSRSAALIQTV